MLMHREVQHITHRNYAFEMNEGAMMGNRSPQIWSIQVPSLEEMEIQI